MEKGKVKQSILEGWFLLEENTISRETLEKTSYFSMKKKLKVKANAEGSLYACAKENGIAFVAVG
uniref:hypothetical protein n=1 Tax=Agathobacter sp. TaxID=2021311 RepID=UPI0040560E60